ncbi:hypothetical protein [Sulfobacillus thermosulfidooxidans]|uniref:hypothetical protein n=1 Tax=Sulfobacillus thermosulfidooxidans TaxID=28034 RepID=UPI0004090AC7|nr:hypothetical protein [Sulfobacillus thermosulfidooxidans]
MLNDWGLEFEGFFIKSVVETEGIGLFGGEYQNREGKIVWNNREHRFCGMDKALYHDVVISPKSRRNDKSHEGIEVR